MSKVAEPSHEDIESRDTPLATSDDDIVAEAHERFEATISWENYSRTLFLRDYRFANADSDNGDQWESDDRQNRMDDGRPCLTVNQVRQHNFSIINDARQNKPAIKFMPTGNGATFESAQIWTALARRIEYVSNASDAYDCGTAFMVQAGFGYLRVVTEYVNERSFAQQLRIVRIPDPLKVVIDQFAMERDKSDAKWALLFEDITKKEFDRRMPKKYHELARVSNFQSEDNSWTTRDTVRIAEYFRVVETPVDLWEVQEEGWPEAITLFEDEVPDDIWAEWKRTGALKRSRESSKKKVEWYYIIGEKIVERNIWPGSVIPIVPFIAEEVVVNNVLDRKSHTRALKDPQRIYNWYTSTAVEFGALQTKTPWIAPAEAIDGLEGDWAQANRVNKSILTYNSLNEDGTPIQAPQRIQPPVSAPLALDGMKVAREEMQIASGQYEAQMGAPSNERSGKAITERQRQGDRATYHYIDAAAVAIRLVGKIILDVVPKIYSERQVVQILAEDGQSLDVLIDPTLQQAFVAKQDENGKVIARMFNPAIGTYDVQADVGPGYATRREETFNALVLLLTQAPQLAGVIGDLLFRSGDFLYADEAAERLRRMVPPQALGQGPSQQEQLLGAQVQKLKELLAKVMDEYSGAKIKLKARDEKRDVDIYNAYTQRLKVLQDQQLGDREHALAVVQLMQDMLSDDMQASSEAIDQRLRGEVEQEIGGIGAQPPRLPGARQAPDGHWYLPDPLRKGKWMRVLPEEQGNGQENSNQGM